MKQTLVLIKVLLCLLGSAQKTYTNIAFFGGYAHLGNGSIIESSLIQVKGTKIESIQSTVGIKVNPKAYAKRSQYADQPPQRPFASDTTLLPAAPNQLPKLANPYDRTQDLTQRARAYLHSNCSSCHQPAGGGNAAMDLRYQVALEQCGLVDESPRHLNFDIQNAKIVSPGKPEESVLLRRVGTRGNGRMPQLATVLVDREAVEMLQEWITTLSSPKNEGGN